MKNMVKGRRVSAAEPATPPPLTLFNTLITVQNNAADIAGFKWSTSTRIAGEQIKSKVVSTRTVLTRGMKPRRMAGYKIVPIDQMLSTGLRTPMPGFCMT